MANDFASVETSGLLTSMYPEPNDDKKMLEALKRKRDKLAESQLGLDNKE